ncbi:MAG: PrsW family intramembrane metalloprotease [Bacteroidales bacterium]|nr:PrsW family intramembrane metalloprotease [Bacteroidales bacterium]
MYETIISLAPALVLLIVILIADRRKPEPFSEVILALMGGIVSIVLCLILGTQTQGLAMDVEDPLGVFRSFNESFFGAGLPEELAKLIVLYLLVRRNKYFDEQVDGIVYAALIGLGFAAYENVLYVVGAEDVEGTAAVRAILSVPGHFMFALLMGYWFSRFWWDKTHRFRKLFLALFIPVIAHTAFDFTCFFLGQFEDEEGIVEIISMVILLGINITGFIMARKFIRRQLAKDENPELAAEAEMQEADEEVKTENGAEAEEVKTEEVVDEAEEVTTESAAMLTANSQEVQSAAFEIENTPTQTEENTVQNEEAVAEEEETAAETEEATTEAEEVVAQAEEAAEEMAETTFEELELTEEEKAKRAEEAAKAQARYEAAKANIHRRREAKKEEEESKKRRNKIWSRIYVIAMIVIACIAIIYLVFTVIETKNEKANTPEMEEIKLVTEDLGYDLVNRPDVIKGGAEDGMVDYMCYTACIYWSHHNSEDDAIAQEWIDKALENSDTETVAMYLNNAAYAYSSQEDNKFALNILDRAIKICPEDANLYDSRGEMLWHLGKKKEAKEMWEKAIQTDPDFLDKYGETTLYTLLEENDML